MCGDAVIAQLLAGFRSFRAHYYERRPERIRPLARDGQRPPVLVIACSDSRVDPAIVLDAEPGELFVVRNVASLVPPYQPDGTCHGTSAALEFAVRDLGVRHIVVMGHSSCGGIQALRAAEGGTPPDGREFIGPWVAVAASACSGSADAAAAEKAAIGVSLDNLMTFPWVRERVEEGRLGLHGWWIDLDAGALWARGRETEAFAPAA